METAGQAVYHQLIDSWNSRDASAFATLFTDDSICIGFDGSEMFGKQEIHASLSSIFKDHPTAKYVTIVREVKTLSDGMVLLRAHVGMIPPNKSKVEPDKNAIQVMVARTDKGGWKIVLFQNTPAQYHGRQELKEKLTQELQDVADHQKK